MDIETFRNYCLRKKAVTEELPFDEVTLVFKVLGKMFALTRLSDFDLSVNLKCDPERAIAHREQYSEIQPGYHMSKVHWNTVDFTGTLSTAQLLELVDHSYDLVVAKMTKKMQAELASYE